MYIDLIFLEVTFDFLILYHIFVSIYLSNLRYCCYDLFQLFYYYLLHRFFIFKRDILKTDLHNFMYTYRTERIAKKLYGNS